MLTTTFGKSCILRYIFATHTFFPIVDDEELWRTYGNHLSVLQKQTIAPISM